MWWLEVKEVRGRLGHWELCTVGRVPTQTSCVADSANRALELKRTRTHTCWLQLCY
jgi:hypothetical protein